MKNERLRVAPAALMPYHLVQVLKKFRTCRSAVVGVVLLTLLTGCIDIESNLTFTDADSGTVEFNYRMYTELYRATAHESDNSQPMVPVLESDFKRLARMHPDLELLSYSMSEDADHVHITVSMAFQSIGGLNFAFGGGDVVTVETTNGRVTVIQEFGKNNADGESRTAAAYGSADEVFSELVEGYRFVNRINTPVDIHQVAPQPAEQTARAVEFELPLSRLLNVQESLQFEVSW